MRADHGATGIMDRKGDATDKHTHEALFVKPRAESCGVTAPRAKALNVLVGKPGKARRPVEWCGRSSGGAVDLLCRTVPVLLDHTGHFEETFRGLRIREFLDGLDEGDLITLSATGVTFP